MSVPPGFVRYAKPSKSVKAITAEGVRLKTFRFTNEPKGELELWTAAIQEQLERSGYRLTYSAPITARKLRGFVHEAEARYQGNEFCYLIAAFVHEDSVYTVEAAGEKSAYQNARAALLEALHSFEID